jgi:hypothetical protein
MTENKAGRLTVIGTAFRRWIIQRRPDCSAIAAVLLLIILVALPLTSKAQSRNNNFEWPTYGADLANTRYRPLDQINASNFNKLEVAWTFKTDNLGPRPEYKLEGTPLMVGGVVYATAGTRRAVVALDAATGELLWMHSENEGDRGAVAPRRLSGRGLAYWSSGDESRVLYVTPGYRLIALDAKTGVPDPGFGENGVVDLKVGAQVGTGDQIDLVKGEIGLHATPVVANDEIIVGAWEATVDLPNDSQAGRVWQRHLARWFVGHERKHRRVDTDFGRRETRLGLSPRRDAYGRLLRRSSSR